MPRYVSNAGRAAAVCLILLSISAGIGCKKKAQMPPPPVTVSEASRPASVAESAFDTVTLPPVLVSLTVPGVKVAAPPEAPVTNDKCRFGPRVSLVRPNGTVAMTSKDTVLHTMHAAAADTRVLFNVSLPIPNMKISKPIDKPGVVMLTCSTHTRMRGYLFVTEELAAISGADGSFKLDNVPAGSYDIRVWHEALKAAVPTRVVVKDGETVTLNVTMK